MPNVLPRGLGGWAKESLGNVAGPAQAVHGCLPAETTWRPATLVYGADNNGDWQIIYADQARAPASATAVVQASTGNMAVKVDWVESVPRVASGYRIFRNVDGSQAGEVPYTTLTFTDTDPRPGTAQTYRVQAVLQGVGGGSVTSNTINLGSAPTWVSCAWSQAQARINLNVTLPADANGYRYQRVGEASPWWESSGIAPGSNRPSDYDGLSGGYRGGFVTERVYSLVNGRQGAYADAAQVAITPLPPQPQYWQASGISRLMYGFWGPPAGYASDYELEIYIGGGPWQAWGVTNSGGPHYYSTTQCSYVRNRTRAGGGVSDWIQNGPACPVNDVTGPGPSNLTSWRPEASWGRMVVKGYWPGDSDTVRGAIWVMSNSDGWYGPIYDGGASPGGYLELAFNFGAACNAQVLVRTWDALGNQGADAYAAYNLVGPDIYFDPEYGACANGAIGNWWSTEILTGEAGYGPYMASYFYGGNLPNYFAGRTVLSSSVEYQRLNTVGNIGCINPGFWVHDQPHALGAPPWFNGAFGGGNVGGNGDWGPCVARSEAYGSSYTLFSLPWFFAAWFSQGWQGLSMYRDDIGSFMQLGGAGAQYGAVTDGRVWMHSLG